MEQKTILIDFTQIPIQKVGVGVYAANTFSQVFEQDQRNHYIALIQSDDHDLLKLFNNVKTIRIRCRNFFVRMLIEQFYIPLLVLKHKVDIIHSLHYSFPIISAGAKRVVTIHDLSFFIYPKLHTIIKRHYFKWNIKLAAKIADKLICVSESTANDLKRITKVKHTHIDVISLACNINKIGSLFIKKPYIAFIGTIEPRKNIEGLIKAFSVSIAERLIIVGKKGWFYESTFNLVKELNIEDQVTFTGFVNDEQKYAILSNAEIFVYPSFYEGFGLPILEALTLGVPTITSNISSLPEVAGNAAILINPHNITEITNAINLLLKDANLREELSTKGIEQSKKYSWDNSAKKTISLYNSL